MKQAREFAENSMHSIDMNLKIIDEQLKQLGLDEINRDEFSLLWVAFEKFRDAYIAERDSEAQNV